MINRPRKLLLEQLQHCHCALQCGRTMGRCLLQIPSLLSAQGAAQLSPLMPEPPPQAAEREESLPGDVSAPSGPSVVTKGHLVVMEHMDGEILGRERTPPAGRMAKRASQQC